MKRRHIACLVLLAPMPFALDAQQAGASTGKQVAATTCVTCHGENGNGISSAYPKLAGQIQPYLVKQLNDFQSGDRQSQVMHGMAMPLSKQDIQNVAAYYSEQTLKPASKSKSGDDSKGAKIYKSGLPSESVTACSTCHGPEAKGVAPTFPRLAGQYADYLEKQLHQFKDGTRTNDSGSLMRNNAKNLSDEQIKAVAEYLSGL